MKRLRQTWEDYYLRPGDTALKDRNLFKLEIEAIIDQVRRAGPGRVLELGCGTGFLIERMRANLPGTCWSFTGVDFSDRAISRARRRNAPNARFVRGDMIEFLKSQPGPWDVIVTQRSIMALMKASEQDELLRLIRRRLAPGGCGVFSECLAEPLASLNRMRRSIGLAPLQKVWHSRYLSLPRLRRTLGRVELRDFSSLYYLVTRVVYPYFEEPIHNSKIADFAARLPQSGAFSFLKLIVTAKARRRGT